MGMLWRSKPPPRHLRRRLRQRLHYHRPLSRRRRRLVKRPRQKAERRGARNRERQAQLRHRGECRQEPPKDSVEVDPSIVVQGLKDALAGGKTLMTDDEAKAVIVALQTDLHKKQEAAMQAAGEVNKKQGDVFLAANKMKEASSRYQAVFNTRY